MQLDRRLPRRRDARQNLRSVTERAAAFAIVACASSERAPLEDVPVPARKDAGDNEASALSPPCFGDFEGGADAAPLESTEFVDVVFSADNAYAFAWGMTWRIPYIPRRRICRSQEGLAAI
jgi:hypothetical protein